MSKKILFLEDHKFFSEDIREYLEEEGYEVFYASNYYEAESHIEKYAPFDFSLIDVILQNGKDGILFVSEHEKYLGRIMFITGCVDKTTLNAISKFASASKQLVIWDKLDQFLEGNDPHITDSDTTLLQAAYKRIES